MSDKEEREGKDDKGKSESSCHEIPGWIQKNPMYIESYIKELAKYTFDKHLIDYKHQKNYDAGFQSASMDIIKDAASNAGKSLIILNGAAAIAVLTKVASQPAFIKALLTYSWGASTGALVFASTYLSQYFFRNYMNKIGVGFQIAAIAFFFIGFAMFIFGGYFTASALCTKISGFFTCIRVRLEMN